MGKGGGAKIPTSAELMEMAEFENTINNPNVSNMFGSQEFTREADGRQTAAQELNPQMQGLMNGIIGNLTQGPSQFELTPNENTNDMINMFQGRVAERSGGSPTPFEGNNVSQSSGTYDTSMPQLPQNPEPSQNPPMPIGIGIGSGIGGGGGVDIGAPEVGFHPEKSMAVLKDANAKWGDMAQSDYSGAGLAGLAANGIGALMQNKSQNKIDKVAGAQASLQDLKEFDRMAGIK